MDSGDVELGLHQFPFLLQFLEQVVVLAGASDVLVLSYEQAVPMLMLHFRTEYDLPGETLL